MKNQNVLFFLTPKNEVDCVYEEDNLRNALHRMEKNEYTTVPIINEHTGKYVGTIAEGDILRDIARRDVLLSTQLEWSIMKIRRKRDYRPVHVNADINELFQYARTQNFVPVVDDTETFIGIVTRSAILRQLFSEYDELQEKLREAEVI